MLLSMTGHGQGSAQEGSILVSTELRSVNNRFLKININSELDSELEARVEEKIRKSLGRGSVTVRIRIERGNSSAFQVNLEMLKTYQDQLSTLGDVAVESLLQMPGVIEESKVQHDGEVLWNSVEKSLDEALAKLSTMRAREGESMARDMQTNCGLIRKHLGEIEKRAPEVVEAYAKRIRERIQSLLEKFDITTQPSDVIREIGIFAERADIAEETVRLHSHLEQVDEILAAKQSSGKKLDFLIQEVLRETNTIGSKAGHAEIAKHVVEIKTLIERLREMVQNVE